jgi:AhpC/TSA family
VAAYQRSTNGLAAGPAPALAVSGVAPEPVTVQSLTAGGSAILLFVNEDCPTSALAMRMLGPLCQDWERRGVSCTVVFEDPLEVAIRVARRCGWTGQVVSQPPPYQTSQAYGVVSVPTAFLVDGQGLIAGSVTGWDQPAITLLIERAADTLGTTLAGPPPTQPLRKPGCSSKSALDPAIAAAMAARPDQDEMEEMFERGWTDGLPVVPPTDERVQRMLGTYLGDTSLGPVPPGMGEATLARLAACAVLAGCRPAYFPVVVAAARAALDAKFNVHGQAVTTQPAGQLIVVNGPVRHELGMNSGMGALGPGNRANLTIGRALRLMIELTGGGMPGALDRSTLGHMGKLGFCIAENEEVSPWTPLHVERGYAPEQSVVTLIGSDAPLSISDHRSRTPEDLGYILAWAAASTWSTNWWPLSEPSVFIICPEHADMFRAHGWSKQQLREYMFEAVRKPAKSLRRGETTPYVHASDPDAEVHKWTSAAEIILLVAGGEAGRYSALLGPCTGMGSQIVSAEVERR